MRVTGGWGLVPASCSSQGWHTNSRWISSIAEWSWSNVNVYPNKDQDDLLPAPAYLQNMMHFPPAWPPACSPSPTDRRTKTIQDYKKNYCLTSKFQRKGFLCPWLTNKFKPEQFHLMVFYQWPKSNALWCLLLTSVNEKKRTNLFWFFSSICWILSLKQKKNSQGWFPSNTRPPRCRHAGERSPSNISSHEVSMQIDLFVHFCNHFIIHAACACT